LFVATSLVASPCRACAPDGAACADALVQRFFAREIDDAARFDGQRPDMTIEVIDLNGDGSGELIVEFRSVFMGGVRGCSTHILEVSAETLRAVGGMLTCGVRTGVMRPQTNGWLDLFGERGGRWRYSDGTYQWAE